VPTSFLGSFAAIPNGANPNIETLSALLPSGFFSLFADGSVDLTGTHISENGGAQSFQIDYMRFDITTSAVVPEPMPVGLVGLGLAGLAWMVRRRSSTASSLR